MKTFKIETQKFLSRIIEIEAKNKEEAILKAKELYKIEKIALDFQDYVSTDISVLKE